MCSCVMNFLWMGSILLFSQSLNLYWNQCDQNWTPASILRGILSEGWSRKGQLSRVDCGLLNGQRFLLNECFTLYTAHH